MASVGQIVRVPVSLAPTGRLGEAPILGRVIAVGAGNVTVLWENGVVSTNVPDGAAHLEIVTAASASLQATFKNRVVRPKGVASASYNSTVLGVFTATLDQAGASPSDRVLVRHGNATAEYASSDVEVVVSL